MSDTTSFVGRGSRVTSEEFYEILSRMFDKQYEAARLLSRHGSRIYGTGDLIDSGTEG